MVKAPVLRQSGMNAEHEAVKKVILELFEAARNKDFETLSLVNKWDERYSKFSDVPPLERLEGERARHFDEVMYTNITDFTCLVEDFKAEVYERCAVATCYLRYGGIFVNDYSFEATRLSARSRATFVLVLDRGRWRIVHQHLSQMSSGEPVYGEE
ncbi:MAG: nuclear transport factor 2 family protein [Thermoprotei archaeon]